MGETWSSQLAAHKAVVYKIWMKSLLLPVKLGQHSPPDVCACPEWCGLMTVNLSEPLQWGVDWILPSVPPTANRCHLIFLFLPLFLILLLLLLLPLLLLLHCHCSDGLCQDIYWAQQHLELHLKAHICHMYYRHSQHSRIQT